MFLRRLIPSMYQRRLLLLGLFVVPATAGVLARLGYLTVAEGKHWQQRAESALVEEQLIPTRRGRILDRHLRVLAEDRPSYDLSVRYGVIAGSWAFDRALAVASADPDWRKLGPDERLELIGLHQQPFDEQVEHLWPTLCRIGAVDRTQLDDRLHTITQRVQSMVSAVRLGRLRRWKAELSEQEVKRHIAQPIREEKAFNVVLTDIDDQARLTAERLIAASGAGRSRTVWNEVSIKPSKARLHPRDTVTIELSRDSLPGPMKRPTPLLVDVEGVGIHLIGTMRNSWLEQRGADAAADDGLRAYRPGDQAGECGLERSFEAHLRGTRGRTVHHRDSGERVRTRPAPGDDVITSVDITLQARLQAIMDPDFGLMKVQPWHTKEPSTLVGMPLRGAAVVIDVAQGQVLAAVTVPTFTRANWRRRPELIRDDQINRPFWNRAVYMPYQPGSTVKPLVLAAAVTRGKLGHDETITCTGHLLEEDKVHYRCWIYKMSEGILTHDSLGASEAVARSCNIFFFTLGRRMGARLLVSDYLGFGLGRRSYCGLIEESAGRLPDLARASGTNARGFTTADSTYMGIGQGPIEWTPLQAANAYATLARGGYWIRPTFVLAPATLSSDEHPTTRDLELDPAGVAQALEGMARSAGEPIGTIYHLATLDYEPIFNVEGVKIYGKSGTATAPAHFRDRNQNGKADGGETWVDFNRNRRMDVGEQVAAGDHAWCIAMVEKGEGGSPGRPDYVVAVVVEYGGSGGLVAGPIANQILHALKVEGYL